MKNEIHDLFKYITRWKTAYSEINELRIIVFIFIYCYNLVNF